MLIFGGGEEVVAKTSEWLQVPSAGSKNYVLICGANGNAWAGQGTSPHRTPANSSMERGQDGVTNKYGGQALKRSPAATTFVLLL